MKKTVEREKHYNSPTKQKILLLLAAGVALGLSRSPTGQRRILKATIRNWRGIERRALYTAVTEFHRDRLVSYKEGEDGNIEIVLTAKGQRQTLRSKLDELEIRPPARWDNFWRVVMFDIPEKKKAARDSLRLKLKELDFLELQKSVWVHPFPCETEINFIIEIFELRNYVTFAELRNLTNEDKLKIKFNLK